MNKQLTPFTEQVIKIINSIPKGKVATYTQVSKLAGKDNRGQAVAFVIHSQRNTDLPWHRVINKDGKIVFYSTVKSQSDALITEGVEVNDFKVDLKKYQVTNEELIHELSKEQLI